MAQLHDEEKKPIKLDVLYVDTTFQKACYETFPKRSETMDHVVREINKWLASDEKNKVALVPSARYGYEYVFNEIYKRTEEKVYVINNWELYSKFLDKLPGVTDEHTSTKIHLCSRSRQYCDICYTDSIHNYLYIKFSAFMWGNYRLEDLSVVTTSDNSISVCFATHCSRSELIHFVEYLAPKKVVGFSDPYRYYTPVKELSTLSNRKTPKSSAKKLEGKRPKKVPKHVLKQLFA